MSTSVYKILGQANPGASTLATLYTVPATSFAVSSSIIIANLSGNSANFRISVAPQGAADNPKQYLAYDCQISGNEIYDFTIGLTLSGSDVVRVYANNNNLVFNIFGEEIT